MPLSSHFAFATLGVVSLSFGISPKCSKYSLLAVVLTSLAVALMAMVLFRKDKTMAWDDRFVSRLPLYALILLFVQSFFLAMVYDQANEKFTGFPQTLTVCDPTAAIFGIFTLVSAVVITLKPPPRQDAGTMLLLAVAIFLTGYALLVSVILYGETVTKRPIAITLAASVGFGLCLSWLYISRFDWLRLGLAFAAGLVLRVATIVDSPDPVIDVFTLLDQGADKLLHGINPYASDYISPYGTERAIKLNLIFEADPRPAGYPAQPYLLAVPFKAIGLDVRFANVAMELLAAVAIFAIGRRLGTIPIAAIVTTLFLFQPRVPLLIEQTWYEPMIAGFLGLGFWLILNEFKIGFWLLGLGLTAKQFGAPMALPIAVAMRKQWLWLALGIVGGLAVSLPFIVWDARAWFDTVIIKHLGNPPRTDSLTLWAMAYHQFGIVIPGWILALAGSVLIVLISWKTPHTIPMLSLSCGLTLTVICLFLTKGFFNYYYLAQYLFLLALPGLAVSKSDQKAESHF